MIRLRRRCDGQSLVRIISTSRRQNFARNGS